MPCGLKEIMYVNCHLLVKSYANTDPLVSVSKCKNELELFQNKEEQIVYDPT